MHLLIEPQIHAANLYRIKGEIDNVTIIGLDVNTLFRALAITTSQRISKEMKDLKNTIDHPDVIDI